MANKLQVNYDDNGYNYSVKKRSVPPFLVVIIVLLSLIVLALGVLVIKNVLGIGDGISLTGDDDVIYADYSGVDGALSDDESAEAAGKYVSRDTAWRSAAVDLLCNYKNSTPSFACDDGFFFYLIDVTSDGVPEVFQGSVSELGSYFKISSFYYWNGSSYSLGTINEGDDIHCFLPFESTVDGAMVFWDHAIPDDYKYHMNNVEYYKISSRIVLDNGQLHCAEKIDRTACVDAILNAEAPEEERPDDESTTEEQFTNVDPSFSGYKVAFDAKYVKVSDFNRAYYGYWGDVNSDEELYDELITREEAKRVVESYLNNDIVGHFD